MRVVFIAGPFRAPNAWEVERNVRRAEELALEVWRAGAAALCPHTNTRFFNGTLPDDVWLPGTLELLRRCDALITAPRWNESLGAVAEVGEAHARGIPIFHDVPALRVWLLEVQP